MTLHKEGRITIIVTIIVLTILNILTYGFLPDVINYIIMVGSVGFFIFILSFFRNPSRPLKNIPENDINCPADGKIVAIEETEELEFLGDRRILVSIFMSPLNVHVNRNPVNGKVLYSKYHPGKYLPAWDPKASTENERTTIAYQSNGKKILMRQIAGALARRIVNYLEAGDEVVKGEDMGFIKLGSRVDLYLPIGSEILVEMDQKVKGNIDVIAHI